MTLTPPRPRVLLLTNLYPNARDPGFGVFVKSQADAIADEGWDVALEVIEGRESNAAYLTAIRLVRRRVRAEEFDVVHAHYGVTGFVASYQPLPLVVTFHGNDLLGTPHPDAAPGENRITVKSRINQLISRIAARRASGVICVSEELRQALPREEDQARAHVIPGGIDLTVFSPGDRATARRTLGIPLDRTVVLFPNTPNAVRKRRDLAEAATVAVGAELLALSGVSYAAMPDYYRAADCLLLTSEWEGSPTVVKEALCCDLPVVAVDAGDAWQWLALAPGCRPVSRDAALIAQAVGEVLSGPRRVDGSRVRDAADQRRTARAVIDVYREVMAALRG